MRALTFPALTTVRADCAELAAYGPTGERCAAFLRGAVGAERLVASSYQRYVKVLAPFARAMGDRPVAEALSAPALTAYVRSLRGQRGGHHGIATRVLPKLDPDRQGSLGRALRGAPAGDGGGAVDGPGSADRRPQAAAPVMPPRVRTTRVPLTAAVLDAVSAEAGYLVASVQSKLHAGTADDADVLRAALVSMCRHAGATPSDLAALRFHDIAAGFVWDAHATATRPESAIGAWWRALRVAPREVGTAKGYLVELALPAPTRTLLAAWVRVRQRVDGVTPDGSAFVWTDPETRKPLTDRELSLIVSGIGLPASGERTARRLAARAGDSPALAESLGGPSGGIVGRIEINPRLLRHALGLEIARGVTDQDACLVAMRERMGAQRRGSTFRYRRLAGLSGKPRGRRGSAGPAVAAAQ